MPESLKPFAVFIAGAAGTATYALIYCVTALLGPQPLDGPARNRVILNAIVGFVAGFPAAIILGPAVSHWLHIDDQTIQYGIVYAVGGSFMRLFPAILSRGEEFIKGLNFSLPGGEK